MELSLWCSKRQNTFIFFFNSTAMSLSKNHDPVAWNYFLSVLQHRRKRASILSPLVISQFVHSRLLSSHLSPSLRWDTRREESRRHTFNKMTYLCFGGEMKYDVWHGRIICLLFGYSLPLFYYLCQTVYGNLFTLNSIHNVAQCDNV